MKNNKSFLLILVFVLFGIYCFVFGESGILEKIRLLQKKEKLENRIARLKEENILLQNKYNSVINRESNEEYFKEEALKSGFIEEGHKLLFFKEIKKDIQIVENIEDVKADPIDTTQLRILWGAASIMIILMYIAFRYRKDAV